MKTTLELPDSLLMEAKAVASRRRTTLRALMEHALRREIAPVPLMKPDADDPFIAGPHGILSLKKRGAKVTSDSIYQRLEEEDTEDR